MTSLDRLTELLDAFPRRSIALVGDLFLDRYLELVPGACELSIETGLEAYQVERVRNSPGALGTVMNNLAALGVGRLVPVTVIGDDGHGYDLLRELRRLPIDDRFVLRDLQRLTPTYTKPLRNDLALSHVTGLQPPAAGPRWIELNRLDVRTRGPLSAETQQRLEAALATAFEDADGLIVLDQIVAAEEGVVNSHTRGALAALAARSPDKLIYVDSRAFLAEFACGTLKANVAECLRGVELGSRTTEEERQAAGTAAERMSMRTGKPVFCTLGADGMLVARSGATTVHVPAVPVTGPVDPVGAGDSATAGIVAALLSGANEVEAAEIGNLVASLTIQQLGTTGTATPRQVIERWRELHG